jgi:hypothetical protein
MDSASQISVMHLEPRHVFEPLIPELAYFCDPALTRRENPQSSFKLKATFSSRSEYSTCTRIIAERSHVLNNIERPTIKVWLVDVTLLISLINQEKRICFAVRLVYIQAMEKKPRAHQKNLVDRGAFSGKTNEGKVRINTDYYIAREMDLGPTPRRRPFQVKG